MERINSDQSKILETIFLGNFYVGLKLTKSTVQKYLKQEWI